MHVLHAAGFESQHDLRQIEPPDFRSFLRLPVAVLRLGPQTQTMAGRGAARATRALIRRGAADFLNEQSVDPTIRIEPGDPRQPGVDHQAHAVDGQGGLGDVGSNNHLAFARVSGQGGVLFAWWQLAVERQRNPIAAQSASYCEFRPACARSRKRRA